MKHRNLLVALKIASFVFKFIYFIGLNHIFKIIPIIIRCTTWFMFMHFKKTVKQVRNCFLQLLSVIKLLKDFFDEKSVEVVYKLK